MSSTNRSRARDSHVADYYVTPVPAIQEFLHHFTQDENINLTEMSILDPCAGGDKANPMSYPEALKPVHVDTIDIREDSRAEEINDFTQIPNHILQDRYNLIITNPPFNIAMDIINKALHIAPGRGYVVMLLRLNFFGSKSRFPFWGKHMPKYAYVHHKRMSFTDKGTDSIEYMHCVWVKGENPEFTNLKVI